MEKSYKKKVIKRIIKNRFIEDLKISFLNFNFGMIYIIHKMLVLLKNHLNYLKDNIFECFFNKYNRILFFFEKINFFHNIK